MNSNKIVNPEQTEELLQVLRKRFEKYPARHVGIDWAVLEARLRNNVGKLWSIYQMEESGGEPDVVRYDKDNDVFVFIDCAAESPKGRRSVCYDDAALESRKQHKPDDSALGMADAMGVELLSEEQYRELQQLGDFDTKTSSWIQTPPDIRKLGGALFCDKRYGHVFLYHNGAESYYAARGFRGLLKV